MTHLIALEAPLLRLFVHSDKPLNVAHQAGEGEDRLFTTDQSDALVYLDIETAMTKAAEVRAALSGPEFSFVNVEARDA